MYFNYVTDQKKFVASLPIATSEDQAVPWVTIKPVTDSDGNIVNHTYEFNSDITGALSVHADAYHNLPNLDGGADISIPKTQIIGPSNTKLVFGNMDSGRVYVHTDNNINDLHTVMDILKKAQRLPYDNEGGYSGYRFGGIDYFDYDESQDKWGVPIKDVTLSVFAMKVPEVVTLDKQIVLNDKVNEITFATTSADGEGITYAVDRGQKQIDVPVVDSDGNPVYESDGVTQSTTQQWVDVVQGDEVNIKKYRPTDKVIFNRIRLVDENRQNPQTLYAPNIKVQCAQDKWIYIRNRSTGAIHNTYLSEIQNLHLYITSIYGTASSGAGIGDLSYLNMDDKVSKRARDYSQNAYVYTVSAEEQAPINDTARMIIIEEEPVVFARSNGINDGTGYFYMNGDGNELPFNKLESRSMVVDGKRFYYPIIGVRAPAGMGIKIIGARAGNGSAYLENETKRNFIDDIISYILDSNDAQNAGFLEIGFASKPNNQFIFLSDHLGNTTEFKVAASNQFDPGLAQDTFLNIYDPLFFEPNLYSPNLDTLELPFSVDPSEKSDLKRAIFLMRDDYLDLDGNLISGNLTSEAFLLLLVQLLQSEKTGDELDRWRQEKLFGTIFETGATRTNPCNLVIIKEEWKGKIDRRVKRITDKDSNVVPVPVDADGNVIVAESVNLHLNSILHLIYDYKGTSGTQTVRKNLIIEIKEDRDELTFGFDASGNIDQTINMSESGTYFNNRNHHILRFNNRFGPVPDSNPDGNLISLELNATSRSNPSDGPNIDYVPIVKLDYNVQRSLQKDFYASSDSTVIGQTPLNTFEFFKSYLQTAQIHYLLDRDILLSYDTATSDSAKDGENLEFGRDYILLDMRDSDGRRINTGQPVAPGSDPALAPIDSVNQNWDFYDEQGRYTMGYFKVEFTPILNEVITVYYQPGQRILKSNISDRMYYRDSIRGYVSLINGDQYLNKSMEYFVEKDIKFRVPEIKDDTDADGNPIKVQIDRIENRRYRLYLDFVPAPPSFDYNKDQKIYDNNIFVTNFTLATLENNKLFLKFSADETKDDMYKIYFSDNALMKGISADGKIAISYQTMINEIMYGLDKYFGKQRDGDPYDSEVYLGAMVMEETSIDDKGSQKIKRVSLKPEFAELQKIIISYDGSTKGADAVVINLTVYMDKNEAKPGELLEATLNNYYGTQGYRIKVLQEERQGHKLYNLNHLDTRTYLSFNAVYTLHLGLNDSKRIVLRERVTNNIVEYNNDPNDARRNEDQTLTLANYEDLLRVPLRRKLDVVKEIGADVLTIDPSHALTLEAFYERTVVDNSIVTNLVVNNLLTRNFFLTQLDVINFEFVYILNNRRFAMNDEDVEDADDDILVGTGFLKLVFTSIINKILAVHFDTVDNQLNLSKLSIQRRIYYKDSILNDYVSLINEDFGNFNKELEYFIEATIDNVTYRLQLDFRPMPVVYDITAAEQVFSLGHMVNLKTTLAVAYDANVTLLFSADNTSDDMHQVNLSKHLLLNNVDNNGNLLLSYTTIRNVIETEMRGLYGKSWYDREMFLFGVIANGQYVMGDGQNNGIPILISPFEYNINEVVEIDLDVGTITFVDQLPDEKWDYSVKAYGEFIAGYYQPNDFLPNSDLEGGLTKIKVFKKAFAQSALLFDQRNPDYNVKEVFLNEDGSEVAVVALGNVDPTTLQNLTNMVYIPDYQGNTYDLTDSSADNYNPRTFTHINPTYIFNPITTKQAASIGHEKLIARGFDLQNKMVQYYAKNNISLTSNDVYCTAYLNPIVHKMLSASLYTRFNNTVFVSYKDNMGMDAPVVLDAKGLQRYPFMNQDDATNSHLAGLTVNPYPFKKRDIIITKIKSELETKFAGDKLFDSRLFKLYNMLGKYETDLEKRLQLINADVEDVSATPVSNVTPYDLEDFQINLLVKFKGTVTGNTGTDAAANSIDEVNDANPGLVDSGATNQVDATILRNLVNEFFPESNVYVDDVGENQNFNSYTREFNARIRYETLIKMQFINRQVTDFGILKGDIDNGVSSTN